MQTPADKNRHLQLASYVRIVQAYASLRELESCAFKRWERKPSSRNYRALKRYMDLTLGYGYASDVVSRELTFWTRACIKENEQRKAT